MFQTGNTIVYICYMHSCALLKTTNLARFVENIVYRPSNKKYRDTSFVPCRPALMHLCLGIAHDASAKTRG